MRRHTGLLHRSLVYWLETVKTVLLAGGTALTMEALEQQALHPAQRVRLEMEARIGEHQVA